mmetsp:Transcript_28269/g.70625  ORF Transcript_28269/g.70625 Transcript_28269/m.70625 type:complete len:476 (-) Transcript_28269:469-1896(-)
MSGPAPSGSSPLAAAFQAASEPVSVRDALAMGGQQQQGGEGEMTQSQLIRLGRTTPAGSIQTGTQRIEVEVPVYTDVHYEDVVAERTVPLHVQKIVPEPEVHELVRQVPELSHSWIERQVEVPVVQHVERIVEVPQVQVVNKYVPKVEVKTIERVVPKTVVKTVERIQEVPVVEYKDKVVEVPHVVEVVKEVPRAVPVDVRVPVIKYVPKVEVKTIERVEKMPVPQYVDVPVQVVKEVPKYIVQEQFRDVPVPGPVVPVWKEVVVEREEVIDREVPYITYKDIERPYEVPVYEYKYNKYPVVIPHRTTTMLPPSPTHVVVPPIIKATLNIDIPPGVSISQMQLVELFATNGIDLNLFKYIQEPIPAAFPEQLKDAKPWPTETFGPLPPTTHMRDGHTWTGKPEPVGDVIETKLEGPPAGWTPNQEQINIMNEHKLTPEQCGYTGPQLVATAVPVPAQPVQRPPVPARACCTSRCR